MDAARSCQHVASRRKRTCSKRVAERLQDAFGLGHLPGVQYIHLIAVYVRYSSNPVSSIDPGKLTGLVAYVDRQVVFTQLSCLKTRRTAIAIL